MNNAFQKTSKLDGQCRNTTFCGRQARTKGMNNVTE